MAYSTLTKLAPKSLSVAVSTLLLGACTLTGQPDSAYFSAQAVPPGTLPPAPMPTYHVGDKFYYSNGWKEKVVAEDGNQLQLLNKANRKLVAYKNFAIPAPYIEGSTAEYYRDSNADPDVLFPLRTGNSARFGTDGHTYYKSNGREARYHQNWICEVDGQKRVHVLAGDFDTYAVTCNHYTTRGHWIKRYTWYYAPELNTYVLRQYYNRHGKEYVRELTALRPSIEDLPQASQHNIVLTWQEALENVHSGESRSWSSADARTKVVVSPLKTFKANNGQYCRTYRQELTRDGETRLYAGVACRRGKLQWRTPPRG